MAAPSRDDDPRWIEVGALQPGRDVLALAASPRRWAEVRNVMVPKQATEQHAAVHQLVLEESEQLELQSLILRMPSVAAPKPVVKRVLQPFKDVPHLTYAPQPKSLGIADAEVWYRQTTATLPSLVDAALPDEARVRAMHALRVRLRDVAARAIIDPLKAEFLHRHPLPELEEFLPPTATTDVASLASALAAVAEPTPRRYSNFAGGMETFVVSELTGPAGYYALNKGRWVASDKQGQPLA